MTDTLISNQTGADRPLSGQPVTAGRRRRGWVRRLGGVIAYDVLLVPVGIQAIADALMDEPSQAEERWQRLSRLLSSRRAEAAVGGTGGAGVVEPPRPVGDVGVRRAVGDGAAAGAVRV